MASSMISALNTKLRMSGIVSGLDTDTIIKQLMSIEQMKVDKVKQEKQLLEWKRDDYRSIINMIRAFKDEYFDLLKPATNIRSATALSAYKTTYNGADTSSVLTATAGSGAIPGTYTVSNIQLATAAKAVSGTSITDGIQGAAIAVDISNISAANDNNKITVTFNGTSKEITIDDGLTGIDAVISNLNAKLKDAFGDGKITAGKDAAGDKITFATDSTNILSIGYAYNRGYDTIFGSAITSSVTLDSQNNKFNLSINGGYPQTIVLDTGTYADADAVVSAVQNKVDAAFGPDKVRVLNWGGKIVLKVVGSTGTATGTLKDADISDGETIDSSNSTFDVTIDGVTKTITLEEKAYTKNELLSAIQAKLDGLFGPGKAMVSMDVATGKLRFEGISATDTITASKKENGGLDVLGFTNANKSNKLDLTAKLSDIAAFFKTDLTPADGDGDTYDIEFTINGTEFRFNSSQTLSEVISTVNSNSEAGVTMSYDQLNDKFIVQSKTMGATAKVQISDAAGNGNLMAALGMAGANVTGTDATMVFDDGSGPQTITRASNDFIINGISFSLKSNSTDPIELKIAGDPTKAVELIKNFVNKYNEVVDKINSELSEERHRDILPLTDGQKEEMSDREIELWEEKARSGMLKNDGLLTGLLGKMREMLYKDVDGVSLYSIGITTGTWEKRGKLVVDEVKLKDAITNSPDQVINLFTKQSSIPYSPDMSAADRAIRDSENGIGNRLYDVMQDYIRTTRNSEGQKGYLLEKAGIVGDYSEFTNLLSKEINEKETLINTLLDKLTDKENRYYAQFTAMEKALSQMNAQSAWLAQQFGGGQY